VGCIKLGWWFIYCSVSKGIVSKSRNRTTMKTTPYIKIGNDLIILNHCMNLIDRTAGIPAAQK
jgi:hypothetical protein